MGVAILLILTTPFLNALADDSDSPIDRQVKIENRILAVAGADIAIETHRVSKSTSWAFNFISPQDLEQRKTNLLNTLSREVGADVIIDPQFTYSKRLLGGGKLTVSGYPARYTNFRTLSQPEIDSLIFNNTRTDKIIFIAH